MRTTEFDRLVGIHGLRGRSVEACRRVLVKGETAYAVSQTMMIEESTISRALKKLRRPLCECCRRPLPSEKE